MLEAFEDAFRQFGDLGVLLENLVALQDGDDLVVSFMIIDQAKSADRTRLEDYVAARDVVFAQHQNIQRIAVLSECPWNKTIIYRVMERRINDPVQSQ